MRIIDKPGPTDPLADADAEEVLRLVAAGRPVTDPELRSRVRERADAVRRQILAEHGTVEWAVDMIREARDE